MSQNEEHLRVLAICHYVLAGLTALFALFPIGHLIIGLIFILSPGSLEGEGEAPPAFIGWFFVIFAAVFITLGWTLAAFILAAGRCLARRRRHLFCLVMGGIECLCMPLGTVLGVFTILVLSRESVKALFTPPAANASPVAS